jgi:hypothetical protein
LWGECCKAERGVEARELSRRVVWKYIRASLGSVPLVASSLCNKTHYASCHLPTSTRRKLTWAAVSPTYLPNSEYRQLGP